MKDGTATLLGHPGRASPLAVSLCVPVCDVSVVAVAHPLVLWPPSQPPQAFLSVLSLFLFLPRCCSSHDMENIMP
eukprot:scaffold31815_cov118-Isochrysis_galbana.AAC.21